MNKERLGNFIGGERRSLGLTQKDLAARLHVTDKAVSKWERGMSYPDVTLLEPLAAALDLTVEELMACRRQAVKGAEETMQNLLDISRDSVRKERRRSWQRLAAVLAAGHHSRRGGVQLNNRPGERYQPNLFVDRDHWW